MRSFKTIAAIAFGFMALTLTGCSMEASIKDLAEEIGVLKVPGQAHGITSGSLQNAVSTGAGTNYKVSASVVSTGGGPQMVNKVGNYTVYSTIQGAVVAE